MRLFASTSVYILCSVQIWSMGQAVGAGSSAEHVTASTDTSTSALPRPAITRLGRNGGVVHIASEDASPIHPSHLISATKHLEQDAHIRYRKTSAAADNSSRPQQQDHGLEVVMDKQRVGDVEGRQAMVLKAAHHYKKHFFPNATHMRFPTRFRSTEDEPVWHGEPLVYEGLRPVEGAGITSTGKAYSGHHVFMSPSTSDTGRMMAKDNRHFTIMRFDADEHQPGPKAKIYTPHFVDSKVQGWEEQVGAKAMRNAQRPSIQHFAKLTATAASGRILPAGLAEAAKIPNADRAHKLEVGGARITSKDYYDVTVDSLQDYAAKYHPEARSVTLVKGLTSMSKDEPKPHYKVSMYDAERYPIPGGGFTSQGKAFSGLHHVFQKPGTSFKIKNLNVVAVDPGPLAHVRSSRTDLDHLFPNNDASDESFEHHQAYVGHVVRGRILKAPSHSPIQERKRPKPKKSTRPHTPFESTAPNAPGEQVAAPRQEVHPQILHSGAASAHMQAQAGVPSNFNSMTRERPNKSSAAPAAWRQIVGAPSEQEIAEALKEKPSILESSVEYAHDSTLWQSHPRFLGLHRDRGRPHVGVHKDGKWQINPRKRRGRPSRAEMLRALNGPFGASSSSSRATSPSRDTLHDSSRSGMSTSSASSSGSDSHRSMLALSSSSEPSPKGPSPSTVHASSSARPSTSDALAAHDLHNLHRSFGQQHAAANANPSDLPPLPEALPSSNTLYEHEHEHGHGYDYEHGFEHQHEHEHLPHWHASVHPSQQTLPSGHTSMHELHTFFGAEHAHVHSFQSIFGTEHAHTDSLHNIATYTSHVQGDPPHSTIGTEHERSHSHPSIFSIEPAHMASPLHSSFGTQHAHNIAHAATSSNHEHAHPYLAHSPASSDASASTEDWISRVVKTPPRMHLP
ncbi:hypothetical protein CBOM_00525 [Ceraceosorus bombacis]|uniref:Uncharacterized protein n=1 Tax=Ceraceosorus bombacis TaxID=401625 RepID=A0A0P1BA19_9BASI|nr:hypothetical protein CBOM_00525 [Ceraceosorus bombacis]